MRSAFETLEADRTYIGGMAVVPGPIPYGVIRQYASDIGLRAYDEWDEFLQLIRAMDAIYRQEKTPKGKKSKGGKKNPKG